MVDVEGDEGKQQIVQKTKRKKKTTKNGREMFRVNVGGEKSAPQWLQ